MHVMMFSLVVVVVVVLTAILFCFWLLMVLFRGITRLFLGPGLKQPTAIAQRDPPHTRRCGRDSCKSVNPAEARFCRRCGQRMEDAHRVSLRRAAML